MKKNKKQGSTLIMITALLVIASIYITTALFDVRGTVDQERIYKTNLHLNIIKNAVMDYRRNNPARPLGNLFDLVSQPSGMASCTLSYSATITTMQIPAGWCGPYLDTSNFLADTSSGVLSAFTIDEWGANFLVSYTGSSNAYIYNIRSCGQNGICNDSDDIPMDF